jgi:hypothetical protein
MPQQTSSPLNRPTKTDLGPNLSPGRKSMPGARRDEGTPSTSAGNPAPADQGALPDPVAPTMGRSDAWPTGAVARHLALHASLRAPRWPVDTD